MQLTEYHLDMRELTVLKIAQIDTLYINIFIFKTIRHKDVKKLLRPLNYRT